jgi:hypothetical protein
VEVLTTGVVLLCGIYLFGKPGMVVPQVNVAMRQLTPLPQANATVSTHTPIASSETNFSKAENPELYITATSRRINLPAQNLQGYPEFSYYGLTFRSPWQETPEIKQGKASVHLQFTGIKAIVLSKTVAGGEWVTAVLTNSRADIATMRGAKLTRPIPDPQLGTRNKFRFTGEALDPGTQLYYLRARYYDPRNRALILT